MFMDCEGNQSPWRTPMETRGEHAAQKKGLRLTGIWTVDPPAARQQCWPPMHYVVSILLHSSAFYVPFKDIFQAVFFQLADFTPPKYINLMVLLE